ncbi:DNA cytosine methyltransferase [Coprococcus comes ATCC 27758]|nr:DNA (cytosine-5-)-methyltransferase [Coprococcus comes]QRT50252.1 DNA (cytosine-5-)-methyltransferase [Coprococcus comes]UWP12824.1 DNA cytosine methyltransferase [Coprococcus comes ATCC 27758]
MKFIDWFAGIGGFRRGMELAGHECVGFCEFDKFATASYISMHLLTDEQRKKLNELPQKKRQKEILKDEYRNGEWYANDVRRVCADDIPKADCWCFGFPCQDISVAGKQLGFQGNRSSLFFRVMYLIGQLKEEDKPTYLFIENVKNLLSVNGGWDFARLLIEMEQGGYDAEWQVLNSKDFGVPQNRERCFIVGHLRGRGSAKVFPVERADGENSVSLNLFGCLNGRNSQRDRVYSSEGLAPTISTKPGGNTEPKVPIIFDTSYIGQDEKVREYEGICPTLTSRDYKEPRSVGVVCNVNPSGKGMNGNVYDSNGVSPSLTTNKGEGNKIAIPVLTPDRAEKRQNGRRFKDDGEPMFTLTGQDRHGVATSVPVSMTRNIVEEEIENTLDTSCNQGIFVQVSEELVVYAVWYERYQCYIAIRKLTPKECFRLQGWTDDYFEKAQFVNSDSQLYKQAGNGVTVNVIQSIAEKMRFA